MSNKLISPEEFVIGWMTTDSSAVLAERWGVPVNTVCTRAKNYRNKGIPLKSHKVGRHPSRKGIAQGPQLDVPALIVLAKSFIPPGRPRRYQQRLKDRRGF